MTGDRKRAILHTAALWYGASARNPGREQARRRAHLLKASEPSHDPDEFLNFALEEPHDVRAVVTAYAYSEPDTATKKDARDWLRKVP